MIGQELCHLWTRVQTLESVRTLESGAEYENLSGQWTHVVNTSVNYILISIHSLH
jgi:hypothetical protein